MSISVRLNKIEKHLKCVNAEGGERFFMVEIEGETFKVYYCSTTKDGKIYKEKIPNAEALNKLEYEEYKQKYMSGDVHCIVDDIDAWEV